MKKRNVKYWVLGRTLAVLAALCLALPPSMAWAGVTIGNPSGITAGMSGNAVYFGAYEQDYPPDGKDPIEWRVLENGGSTLFLLSEKNLDAKPYDKDNAGTAVSWEFGNMGDKLGPLLAEWVRGLFQFFELQRQLHRRGI